MKQIMRDYGGDSGSPLFVDRGGELEVLGIASRLTQRDKIPDSKPVNYQCTVDIVYTKISTHRHWIETTALEMMAP